MKKFGMMLMMACGLALGATPQPSNTLASATDPTIRRPNRPAWRLPTYTLVARDMDLRTAFDTFAVSQGLSIVMSDSVGGRFSGDFRDTPTDEFLEKMAQTI